EPNSSNEEYNIVNESIKRINKRIIIFIDDLDRLDGDEIISVLKIIRNTGNFKNLVYVSCYDKVYLLNALQRFSKRNLDIILDKFFDIEIPLSPIPTAELFRFIEDQFLNKFNKISEG